MSNWDPFPDCAITPWIAFSSCVAKSELVADADSLLEDAD